MPSAVDILKNSQARNANRVTSAAEDANLVGGESPRSDSTFAGLEPLPPPTGGALSNYPAACICIVLVPPFLCYLMQQDYLTGRLCFCSRNTAAGAGQTTLLGRP